MPDTMVRGESFSGCAVSCRPVPGLRLALLVCALAAPFFAPSSAYAVPFVDRGIVPDPLSRRIEGEGGFLQSSSGWGEFSNYLASSDGEHAWDAKLGASVEVFRLRNLWSVDIGSDVELVASPNDDIHFKPRVFYWQESLFVMRRWKAVDWGIGYYHRCRHDIDNLDEYEMFNGEKLERVCIYDSVTLRAYPDPIGWNWGGGASGSARLTLDEHAYVLRQDSFDNSGADPLTLNNLLDTVALGLETEPFRRGMVGWYLNFKEYTDIYNSGGLVLSADILAETGLRFHGAGAAFDVFLRFEHFAETLMDPWRQEGDYLSLGLRLE